MRIRLNLGACLGACLRAELIGGERMYQGFFHVVNAGPTATGPTEVKIRPLDQWPDGSTDDRWFLSSATVPRETLATALAAMTSAKAVYCEIPDEQTQYSQLSRFLLNE